MNILILVLLVMAACSLGVYLLIKKNPLPAGQSSYPEPKWLASLPETAQAVHRKEWNKQTAAKFSMRWFLEYISGQRSAFYAFLTWFIAVPLLLAIPQLAALVVFGYDFLQDLKQSSVYIIVNCIYTLFACYILWVCASNSTSFFKTFVRVIVIISTISTVLHFFNAISF